MRSPVACVAVAVLGALASCLTLVSPSWAEYGTVTLEWTAPGDDSLVGTARSYDLRYCPVPLTAALFSYAFKVNPDPVPQPAGKLQSVTVHGLTPGTAYWFAIRTVDDAGNWSVMSNVVRVIASYPLAGVDGNLSLDFSLPFPNPSREAASFAIETPTDLSVAVDAFDVSGRKVRTLLQGNHPPGRSTLVWDLRDDSGRPLASGLYLVRARVGERTFVRRVTVGR